MRPTELQLLLSHWLTHYYIVHSVKMSTAVNFFLADNSVVLMLYHVLLFVISQGTTLIESNGRSVFLKKAKMSVWTRPRSEVKQMMCV